MTTRTGSLGSTWSKRDYRGKGFGLKLWHAAMAYLNGRNVGLDGVLAQQANYRKSGFTLAYRNIRYQGKGDGSEPRVWLTCPRYPLKKLGAMT